MRALPCRGMAGKRTYGDRCGVARALDIVGERWALLVVRELLLGPKRFTDLRAGLPQVSPDILSQRLRELEEAGIVRRRTLPPPAGSRVYELTGRGEALEPVILALGRWGSVAPVMSPGAAIGVDAFVIALKTLFDPGAAAGAAGRYELRLGDQAFRAEVAGGELAVARGPAGDADAAIAGEPGTLAAVLWHDRPLEAAERSGALAITGSRRAATRFLRLFPLPA
jgi:DNA-binding HxlR family transcriptional regulator